ncbi:MAG: glutaminyl-peptide cyclotransferase [Stenotrophobium sp.]
MEKKQSCFFAQNFFLLALLFCADAQLANAAAAPVTLGFSIVQTYPHDVAHFTEGLLWHDGKLYESTGLYGRSALYEIDLASGRTLRSHALDSRKFGEGLALSKGRLIQLTWKAQVGLIWSLAFNSLGHFRYATEGWGLCTYDHQLVMSDGSDALRFLSADDFHVLRTVTVHDGDRTIDRINELETVDGLIYANVWTTNLIIVIDPKDGRVLASLDLSALKDRLMKPAGWDERENVLNGIAYDPTSGNLLVTGKRWPSLFEIRVTPRLSGTDQAGNGRATPQ